MGRVWFFIHMREIIAGIIENGSKYNSIYISLSSLWIENFLKTQSVVYDLVLS